MRTAGYGASEIASGSKLGMDATKKLSGLCLQPPNTRLQACGVTNT